MIKNLLIIPNSRIKVIPLQTMTRLFLVRHGETVDNVNRIMQGQTQGELTDNGRRQALEVMRRMENLKVDAFVSSDLKRSVDTCTIIARPHGMEIKTTKLLRELELGGFTGRFIPHRKDEPWPDDVETLDALLSRARSFIAFVKSEYPDRTVVAVGHGIINKAIQAVHYGKEMRDVARMDNAEVRCLML